MFKLSYISFSVSYTLKENVCPCGWQASKMAPNLLCLLKFTYQCNVFSYSMSWSDLLLIKSNSKIEGMSLVWSGCKRLWLLVSKKTLLPFQHACFDEASCMMKRPMWQGTVALNSTTHKELNPSELGGESFPNQTFKWDCSLANILTTLMRNLEVEDSSKMCPDFWTTRPIK